MKKKHALLKVLQKWIVFVLVINHQILVELNGQDVVKIVVMIKNANLMFIMTIH